MGTPSPLAWSLPGVTQAWGLEAQTTVTPSRAGGDIKELTERSSLAGSGIQAPFHPNALVRWAAGAALTQLMTLSMTGSALGPRAWEGPGED